MKPGTEESLLDKKNDKWLGGVLIGAGGVLAGKLIKDHIDKKYISDFLRKCSDFEKTAKSRLQSKRIPINSKSTFNDLIRLIQDHRLLEYHDIRKLREIRDMRNKVVHGDHEPLKKMKSDQYIRELRALLRKI